jgi:Protein of unknown function (DUF2794)
MRYTVVQGHRGGGGARGEVYFDRQELRVLLDLYSQRVISGEWRDYALAHDGQRAVFAAFQSSLANPQCTVEKLARGAFRLTRRTRRGSSRLTARSFAEVLRALNSGPRLVARS